MKRLFLSFVTLLAVLVAQAQGSFTVSGSVTDLNGGALANEPVVIIDSLSTPPVFALAITDASGNYSASLQGSFQAVVAAVQDCNGQAYTQNVLFNGGTTGTANFSVPCGSGGVIGFPGGGGSGGGNPGGGGTGGGGGTPGGTLCDAFWVPIPDTAGGVLFFHLGLDSTLTYAWDFGDGTTSADVVPSHTYAANGVYNVCLTISDGAGCTDTFCDSVAFPLNQFPGGGGGTGGGPGGGGGFPGGGGNYPFGCFADFFAFGDTTLDMNFISFVGDSSLTYAWDFGDGNTSNVMDPMHTYAAAGTYNVCLIVSDAANNCADTLCQPVQVPFFTGPWGPGTGTGGPWGPGNGPGTGGNWGACDAFFFPLTDSSLTADFFPVMVDSNMTYAWDFGDGNTSSVINPSHTFGSAGAYIVTLTVSGQTALGSCTATFAQAVVVPFDSTICGPWNPGYGFPGGGNGGPIIITLPGGGGPWGNPCSAMFMPLPDTVPLSYFFVRLPLDSGLTYAWDFGDGNTSSSPLPNHIYAGPGNYGVCLTVSDAAAGCTDTFCDTITVTNATWSGGSFAPQTVSLGESSIQELKAYPNPTSGGLNVSYSSVESSDVALRLIDMAGRVLIDENASAREGQNNETLDLSGFPAGSYVLQVVQGSSVDYLRIVKP